MTRWKASAIHLAISITIALITLTLMMALWYAPPFFSAAGGGKVLLIMLGVDVTLGPLITLLVFNPAKKLNLLRFDLTIIALLQLSALIYGVNVMFHSRPAFVVYSKGSFDLVLASDLSDADLAKAKDPIFSTLSITGPIYTYTEMPKDAKEQSEVVFAAFSGKDLPFFPQYYQELSLHLAELVSASKSLSELKKYNPYRVSELENMIAERKWSDDEVGYLPLRSKFGDIAIVINRQSGKVIGGLDMEPWQ